jgi:membrane protein required for colicin V production
MSTLDWALLAVLAVSGLLGLWRGVIRETLSLAAWLLGFVLSSKYASALATQLPLPELSDNWRRVVAWALVFIGPWLVLTVLAALLRGLVSAVGLGLLDRFMGGVFGLLRGGIALMALSVVVGLTPVKTSSVWMNSWMAQLADWSVLFFKPVLPAQLERLVS